MSKKKPTKKVPRNGYALAAKSRKGGAMKHRLEPKKSAKNEQRELLEQAEEEQDTIDTDKVAEALEAEYRGTIDSKGGYFGALDVAAEKTGYDAWLAQQMKNPEFKRMYDEMIEEIENECDEDGDD